MKRTEIIILIALFFFTNISCKSNTERKTMESTLDSILNVALTDTVKKLELEKNTFTISSTGNSMLFFISDTNKIFVDGSVINNEIENYHADMHFPDNIYIFDYQRKKVLDSVNLSALERYVNSFKSKGYAYDEIEFLNNNSYKIKATFPDDMGTVFVGDFSTNKVKNISYYLYWVMDLDNVDTISNKKLELENIFYSQEHSHTRFILYQDTLYAGIKSAQVYDKNTFLYSIKGNNFTFKNNVKFNTDSVYVLLPFPLKDKIYFYYNVSDNKTILYGFDVKKCYAKKYILDFTLGPTFFTNDGFLTSYETIRKEDDFDESYKYSFIKY